MGSTGGRQKRRVGVDSRGPIDIMTNAFSREGACPCKRTAPAVLKGRRKEIGKRLRRIRKEIAPGGTWTRPLDVKAWLGVRLETWYLYELGKAAIPGDIVLRLIVELGISPRWLLTGRGTIWPDGTSEQRSSRDDAPSTA